VTFHVLGKRLTNTGFAFGDRDQPRRVEVAQVVAIAKQASYGDARTLYWLRLVDGTEVYVNASKQEKDAERWLRKQAKPIHISAPNRDIGWLFVWREVA